MNKPDTNAPAEQIAYANILFYGCWSGLALMLLTYMLYVTGLMEPYVSMELVTKYWAQPVGDYLSQNNVPTGWGWATLLSKGDFLNFLGIALLGGLTIVAYIPVTLAYFKKKTSPSRSLHCSKCSCSASQHQGSSEAERTKENLVLKRIEELIGSDCPDLPGLLDGLPVGVALLDGAGASSCSTRRWRP